MLINIDLLLKYDAVEEVFSPSQSIYSVGEEALHYYQIKSGLIKLNHIVQNEESIQNIVTAGDTICDLMALTDERFPLNAVAVKETTVIKVPKYRFKELIKNNQDVSTKLERHLARRVYQNKLWMQHFYLRSSEERILRILQYFKNLDNVFGWTITVRLCLSTLLVEYLLILCIVFGIKYSKFFSLCVRILSAFEFSNVFITIF